MRIVQLTPGTGGFHCGTCLRDHDLVDRLRRLGHEVEMVPLYLPFVTDGTDAAPGARVRMGAVRLWMRQRWPKLRAPPRWLERRLDADWLLRWAAGRSGTTQPAELGDLTVSLLRGEEGCQAGGLARLEEELRAHRRADVVCLSNGLLVGLARRLAAGLGAPVVCFLQGEDRFLDALPEPFAAAAWRTLAERARDVAAFVAASAWYGGRMSARLALPAERIHVVPNGIRTDDLVPAGDVPRPPVVGYLARMIPDKGLDRLAEAFVCLRKSGAVPEARLAIAGACTRADEPWVAGVKRGLEAAGLAASVEWRPNLSRAEKAAFLRGLTVLSVPARGDSFGRYVLEALACAVPVVLPRDGAFPELLAATGGGILCDPDDPEALAGAIAGLLADPARARELGRRGREAVLQRFGIERMARDVAAVLEAVAGAGR